MAKSRKKGGRFDGLTEEQVKNKDSLPDYLEPDLDIVFLGINPSLMAAHKGRYYAGPGNHFYKLLHAAELVPRFISFEEDDQLLQYKIGLTNIVARATRSSADLSKSEIKKGCDVVTEKMINYKPKIAVFNGKCIYQVFVEQMGKTKFNFGLQHEKIGNTVIWVVPSSSARCSNFPRMDDKLPFFLAIKKHLQFLKGEIEDVNVKEFYFDGTKNQTIFAKKQVKRDPVEDSPEKEFPQFVVMEILDGSQKNQEKELSNEEVASDDNKTPASLELQSSEENFSVESENGGSSKPSQAKNSVTARQKRLLENKDTKVVSESKKKKKLNFSNIQKNRGTFDVAEVT